MRNNPKGWTYDEIVPILRRLGFEFQSGDKQGSHRYWHHPSKVTVGFADSGHGEVKPVYIKQFLEAIDSLEIPNEDKDDAE